MMRIAGALFAYLQYLLPRHWMTRAVYRLARIRAVGVKDALIRSFVRLFNVNVDEVAGEVPADFATLNAFFIRELKADARPVAGGKDAIVSPVDGTVSECGSLQENRILQAKGIDYTLEDLFAIDLDDARQYRGGTFATLYLAPYNYHRVHMPVDGELVAAHYVPGDLFSVNRATAAHIDGLFRRNERLNLHFDTPCGPAALIFVGALNVGSISTPWTGEIRPRSKGVVESRPLDNHGTSLARGDLLGWFNMGSTVICLFPEGVATWNDALEPGATVRMGEAIGTLSGRRA
ncbi:MAG: archaetidylserine decarboxylase [Woeseiaceae bacterium]|nr:archaetidylserine decarboxylase [Woeseiaceae bacterium]